MKRILRCLIVLVSCVSLSGGVLAQISVTAPGQDVIIGKDGSVKARSDGASVPSGRGNNASVTVGGISDDADIEGVTVINGRVSIDGKDVPSGVTRYKSPKSGKVYLIQRKDGSVSVNEAGGGR